MDIIHGLSNLDIEATHSSSSSSQEEQVKRNWVDLPTDVLSMIFLKLDTNDILVSAQWVCTSWWKFSKQPHLFRSIHLEKVETLFGCSCLLSYKRSDLLAREAIDRSCGQLVEFSVRYIAGDGLLHYMSDKSASLRCIRLVDCFQVSADVLIEMAKKLSQLEDFEVIDFSNFTEDVIEAYGRLCPRLKSCRLNYVNYQCIYGFHSVVVAIAQNMPELRYLNLFGNRLTDDGLIAVLDGCPHLESLDLRQCFDLKLEGDLKVRCGNLKVLRLPNDPTDDFEYEIYRYPLHGFSDSDSYSVDEYSVSDDRYPTHDFSDSNSYSCDEYSGSDDCYPTHDFPHSYSDDEYSGSSDEYSGSDDRYPTHDFSHSYSDDEYSGSSDEYSGSDDRYPTHDFSHSNSYSGTNQIADALSRTERERLLEVGSEYRYPTHDFSDYYSGSDDHYPTHDFSDYYSGDDNDYDYDEFYGYDDNDYDFD